MTETEIKQIYKLYSQGKLKILQAARENNCTTQYIYLLFKKYNLPKPEKKRTKDQAVKKKCEVCGTMFLAPYPFIKKTCSQRCSYIATSRKNTKINIKKIAGLSSDLLPREMTTEQRKKIHNTRVLYYYRTNSKIKSSKKNWAQRNKEKLTIYAQRSKEKKLYGKPITPLPE